MLPSRNMGNARIGKCGWSGNAGRELEGENIWQDSEKKPKVPMASRNFNAAFC